MDVLEALRQYAGRVRENVGLLGSDPAEYARQALLGVLPSEAEYQAAKGRLLGGESDPQAFAAYRNKVADMGNFLGSIKVYHGSPHKFDKFDLSKIGTGEGAQVYGHGAYVAESPDVARAYANTLSGASQMTPEGRAARALAETDGDVLAARQALYREYNAAGASGNVAYMNSAMNAIEALNKRPKTAPFIYEADLRWPDAAREAADPMGPQHFLDWDAPVSAALHERVNGPAMEKFGSGATDTSGQHLYSEVLKEFKRAGHPDPKNATIKWFSEQGIPGIRYLDAGSRAAEQGTNNYVVFDDAMLEILKRNGVPVTK